MATDYKGRILEGIINGEILFDGHSNYGTFFPAGDGLVAKIFSDYMYDVALQEFEYLKRFKALDDSRIRVPEAYGYISLGRIEDLKKLGLSMGYCDNLSDVYVVVMELLEGKHWGKIDNDERRPYAKSLIGLMDALIEYKIDIWDLKGNELICIKDTEQIGLVDTHLAVWGSLSSSTEWDYNEFRQQAEKALS
ncbi:MAG: hypothetical protein KKA79_06215 [Nanoarchaeota archaeon]|nr:hypothetical protein [Nanoarchaeota archaeon]